MSQLREIKELIKGHEYITIESITFKPRKISDPRKGTLKMVNGYKVKNCVVIRYKYKGIDFTRYITFPWLLISNSKGYINIEIRRINKEHNQQIKLI